MPDNPLYNVLRRSCGGAHAYECMPERVKALYRDSSRVLRVLAPRLDRFYLCIVE